MRDWSQVLCVPEAPRDHCYASTSHWPRGWASTCFYQQKVQSGRKALSSLDLHLKYPLLLLHKVNSKQTKKVLNKCMEMKPWTTWKFTWKHIPVGALPKCKRVSLLALWKGNVSSVKGKWVWSDSYSYSCDLDQRKGIDLCCISECNMSESYQKKNLHIKAYLFTISQFSDLSLQKKKTCLLENESH